MLKILLCYLCMGVLNRFENRGAVVEWLEWLGYGAESRNVMSSRLGFAMR